MRDIDERQDKREAPGVLEFGVCCMDNDMRGCYGRDIF